MQFIRPEHNLIAQVLGAMNGELLLECHCFFAGGTAIVLKHGEYRRSLDIDFMCADGVGYRTLRNAFFDVGVAALFSPEVKALRDVQSDGYGIRCLLQYGELRVKFEIVREARIQLKGEIDPIFGVPLLSIDDMFAEKLLANADRCYDRTVAYRDAIDLGVLITAHGEIPAKSVKKAETAYGADIARKLAGIVNFLLDTNEIRHSASIMDMNYEQALHAIDRLRSEARRLWPDADIQNQ